MDDADPPPRPPSEGSYPSPHTFTDEQEVRARSFTEPPHHLHPQIKAEQDAEEVHWLPAPSITTHHIKPLSINNPPITTNVRAETPDEVEDHQATSQTLEGSNEARGNKRSKSKCS